MVNLHESSGIKKERSRGPNDNISVRLRMKNLMNQVGRNMGYGSETDLERGNYILCVQLNNAYIPWGSGWG